MDKTFVDNLLKKLEGLQNLPNYVTLRNEYIPVIREFIFHERELKVFLSNEDDFRYPPEYYEDDNDIFPYISYDDYDDILILDLNLSSRSWRELFYHPFYLGNRFIFIQSAGYNYYVKINIYGEVLPRYLTRETIPNPCPITKNIENCSGKELLYLLEHHPKKLSVCQEIYYRMDYFHKNNRKYLRDMPLRLFVYSLYSFGEYLDSFPNYSGEERTVSFLSVPLNEYKGRFSYSDVTLSHIKGDKCIIAIYHDTKRAISYHDTRHAVSYEVRYIQYFS